jgi:hypothetical protein
VPIIGASYSGGQEAYDPSQAGGDDGMGYNDGSGYGGAGGYDGSGGGQQQGSEDFWSDETAGMQAF